jgi:uncharacterized RDD family membrane protein YckC
MNDSDKEILVSLPIKLSYVASTTGKTISAGLFDFFVMLVIGLVMLFGSLSILQTNSSYKEIVASRNEVLISSELYYDSVDGPVKISTSLADNTDLTYNEKSQEMDTRLTYFFQVFLDGNEKTSDSIKGKGLTTYLSLKAEANTDSGEKMFATDYSRLLTNSDYDDDYYSFYTGVVKTAIGYLQANPDYLSSRNLINRLNLWTIILTIALSYIIFYLIISLCCTRGKRTLGMTLTKIGLVGKDGLSCSTSRYLCHFLFNFVFVFLGSIFAFLIPLAISLTMIIVRKDHRCLTDYVVNTFLVSTDEATIYKDEVEYRNLERKRQRIDESYKT